MDVVRYFFEAKLSNGQIIRDIFVPSEQSVWIKMLSEFADSDVFISQLSLRSENGHNLTLPSSNRYFHLKKAVFEFNGTKAKQSYAVGFQQGDSIVFAWGNPNGIITLETRPINPKQICFAMRGSL